MSQGNEAKMKRTSAGFCSYGSSSRHTFGPSVRLEKAGSGVKHYHCLHILLLAVLLAGQASCVETDEALPTVPPTNTQPSVYSFFVVTVDVKEEKDEAEIVAWLKQVFANKLHTCLSPNIEETTVAPTSPQTTSPYTSYETTLVKTATSTLQSYNSTTALAITRLKSNNHTTNATTTTLKRDNTTAAATVTVFKSITRTPAASTTALKSITRTPTESTTELKSITRRPAASTTAFKSITKTTVGATLLKGLTTNEPGSTLFFKTTLVTKATGNRKTKKPKPDNGNNKSLVREIRASVTKNSATISGITSDLFQDLCVSCINKTAIKETNCSVLLRLKQQVPLCCIFRTLYEASQSSSDIHVVGANKTGIPKDCSSNNTDQDVELCEDTGTVAPLGNSAHCGAVHNPCNCSVYCNGVEAFYTFRFSVQDSMMNFSYVLSMIHNLVKPDCPSREDDSCPLSVIASEYRNANVTCGSTSTNLQICRVTLRFGHEVPFCHLSKAVIHLFESEPGISYNGHVTRAAICGNSFSDNPLNSITMWTQLNIPHVNFCQTIVESNILTCHGGKNMLVELKDSCDVESCTPSPNVTTSQPSTSTSSVNATLTTANVPESAESQANALLELTKDMSKLNSSQVRQLVSKLERLLSGPTVSFALGNISVHIVSNLLGATPEVLSDSSNSIIGVVDTVGLKLVLDGKVEYLLSSAVALSVKPADGSNFQETVFSISDPKTVQVRGAPSRPSRKVRADPPLPQGSIKLPPSLTEDLTSQEQQLVSRVQFNFYQKDTVYQDSSLRGKRKLNSGILGASAANLTIEELQDDVVIQLKNTEPVPANFVAICVFWDFTFNNDSGGWNPRGCSVRKSTDNETVCGCNHLTSFAILLDLARQPLTSRTQATILTFITYIGCGVSAIFLSITLLTYLAFGKLRKDIPSKILIQLCLALLLLNLVFLVDAWLALYPEAVGLCISTAWFLHYFLLVTFTWMGLEAVHMYLALVKVFNSYISHYMVKFSLVGWGIPMIVVIIVIAVDKDNYGLVSYGRFSDGTSDGFCWLKNDIAFYVSVVAYFCLIFVFNFVMFVVVLVQLCRIKRQNPHNLQHRSILQDMRSVSGITILLGLTWGFAFFAWGPLNLPFMYLFAIFNSFQGFFIFIFYCVGKENVRKQWRTFLCCGRMRLAENSEWSRTATQKTATKSSVNRVTSLHSSNSSQFNNSSSSSCFLVSDSSELTNGISSQFEDNVITAEEDYSTDVVLNEINMQYRNQQTP
ncbi:adhesion G-protein coupled receptor G2 [Trematomus bernacchii]|uniref:adhesion G-protein coupled receptor G2 n=1 Tax=Trematomus bernacchii TaxID=40690 RepID=UPI00146C0F74|nr:adhesion G-protein coupled receptor G2 [Trematomus bernacchii]XP_033995734.1 adhesion G-protein coupled receptor G2 [Trematomus bernacchii]